MRRLKGQERPVTILVVDDENFFAEWLAENLRDTPQHYEAHWVNSGERALQFIDQKPVDLVISDIKMPGVSGIELLNQIRSRRPGIGVILMTGYALPELQQEAVKRGSLLYLEKPFPMDKLEAAIEQALELLSASLPPAQEEAPTSQLSLLDTLHLFHVSRSNKTVLVKMPETEGLIYYQDGEVVHAVIKKSEIRSSKSETNPKFEIQNPKQIPPVSDFDIRASDFPAGAEGEAALSQIIDWASNDYEVLTDEPAPIRSIFRDFDSLISAAVSSPWSVVDGLEQWSMDQGQRTTLDQPLETGDQLRSKEPPATSHQPPAISSEPGPVERAEASVQTEVSMSDSIVSRAPEQSELESPALSEEERRSVQEVLSASEHLNGGALITTKGKVLASTLPRGMLAPEVMTQAGAWAQLCHQLSEELGRGSHRQSLIQGDLGNVIVAEVGGEWFLLFVTSAKATLGLALLQARQRAQKIEKILNPNIEIRNKSQ